jgi:hypothetical protein
MSSRGFSLMEAHIRAWFKKGSGPVVRRTLRAGPATVPDPFLNHAHIRATSLEKSKIRRKIKIRKKMKSKIKIKSRMIRTRRRDSGSS